MRAEFKRDLMKNSTTRTNEPRGWNEDKSHGVRYEDNDRKWLGIVRELTLMVPSVQC